MDSRQRGAQHRAGCNHLKSNKRKWNNCFCNNALKIQKTKIKLKEKRPPPSPPKKNDYARAYHICRGLYKYVIDQASFLHVYEPYTRTKKKKKEKPRPISSHLDRKSLVNKGFIILLFGFQRNLSRGTQRVVPSGQDGSILPAHGTSHIIKWFIAPAAKPIKTPELHYLMIQLLEVCFF